MKVVDEKVYEDWKAKNTDGYGSGIFRYAEKWANMMEEGIEKGDRIRDIASKLSHDADTEGITGFMYGAAVSVLSQCWVHGEELKKWHNKEYDYEGDGVANPALITITKK
ncbi:hypothetical protein JBP901_gp062 [Bacillus phage JBP901]|uniref:Uncharacterized protein n=1 Tax=Bacillus phage JBP901 TaxID=1498212 RepID=A0A0E3DEW0_9CAUD|nr:hypothetical protein JBP901_gp062 [Bacillus phage JBP901]ANY29284.1 hypothetical protein [Bacillus phage PK16]AUM58987.1 hypothetical protein BCP01_186 [Bacillus phage BCP01]UJH95698.1 hypothetical protein [Bacillus phage vB_BtM_BMBsp2]WPF70209.1 hypothetical protein BCVP_CDS0181 [Bacillus phage BC-VP]AID17774.1 hypothetical protein JBP901_gp062 [Bacillus phage JBP901]